MMHFSICVLVVLVPHALNRWVIKKKGVIEIKSNMFFSKQLISISIAFQIYKLLVFIYIFEKKLQFYNF
jgi:hypothetical protein